MPEIVIALVKRRLAVSSIIDFNFVFVAAPSGRPGLFGSSNQDDGSGSGITGIRPGLVG